MSDQELVRTRDGDLRPVESGAAAELECCCDGSGDAGIVTIGGRDVLKVCVVCRPHLAGRVPTVAQRAVGHGVARQRRRLALVR